MLYFYMTFEIKKFLKILLKDFGKKEKGEDQKNEEKQNFVISFPSLNFFLSGL